MTAPDSQPFTIIARLQAAAERVEQTIEKFDGVLDLRTRQIATASALGSRRSRDENVAATLSGYAADLDRYSSELRPPIDWFRESCEELRMHYSRADYVKPREVDSQQDLSSIRPHIDSLKLARAARDIVTQARAKALIADPPNDHLNASVRRHIALLDQYLAALLMLEGVALDMLVALGSDATQTSPPDRTSK